MEDQESAELNKVGEQSDTNEQPNKLENDPETIANRVLDAFWESLQASKDKPG